MPHVKLIKYHGPRGYEYECDNFDTFSHDISDWQEISDEDLSFLKDYRIKNTLKEKHVSIVILEDITKEEKASDYIKDIKKYVADQKKKEELRIKKMEESDKKRKETAEKRRIEKAQKLLKEKGML